MSREAMSVFVEAAGAGVFLRLRSGQALRLRRFAAPLRMTDMWS